MSSLMPNKGTVSLKHQIIARSNAIDDVASIGTKSAAVGIRQA